MMARLGSLNRIYLLRLDDGYKFKPFSVQVNYLINMESNIYFIAKVCHESNRVWCQANGDNSQKHWKNAEQWQRDSAIVGVTFRINNPDAKHDAQHNAWMQDKVKNGWVFGEVKDAEKKTHPCIVPFEQLPEFQQKKDALFCAIVDSLK